MRFYRENAAMRVAPLWSGMQDHLPNDYFIIPALRNFLVLINLSMLVRLHFILHKPAKINPVYRAIDFTAISSDRQLLMHPVVRSLLNVNTDEVFWAARYFPEGLPEMFNYGITVWAPKSIIIEAYWQRLKDYAVTNGFIHRFAIPQTESELLYRLSLPDLKHQNIYSETNFRINKLFNENYKEIKEVENNSEEY
ncbi:MAG: hypothetical protein ICV53_23305 [Flavisolibacter sp.]|nr:hypothetical protein [Flavisolibacter sp.]